MKMISNFNEYQEAYKRSVENPESFWNDVAQDFVWKKRWDKVLEWDFHKPEVKWYTGARVNITENCLDRHLRERGDQTAIIWEPNDPRDQSRKITYRELHEEVCRV